MNKRTVLKTLAFVVGLYFFLEYILPEKIGGDFDCFEVRSPVAVVTPHESLLLYVGHYRKEIGAVGRMITSPDPTTSWRREPDTPVMQRSLFMTFDRWGMDQLDALATTNGLYMLYIGLNPEQLPVLCYAVSRDAGRNWDKRGPVLFTTNAVPQPSVYEPNGRLPGSLEFFAARHDGTHWQVLLVLKAIPFGPSLWQASGTSLTSLAISDRPLLYNSPVLDDLDAFDARNDNGTTTLYFAQGTTLTSGTLADDNSFNLSWHQSLSTNIGSIASLRVDPDSGHLYFGTEDQRSSGAQLERSLNITRLYAMAGGGAGRPESFKQVGRPAQPTYLSRGTKWAGEFMQIVGSFAIFIAMINLVLFHGKKIARLQKNSYNSIVFLIFLGLMIVLAYFGTPDDAKDTAWRKSFDFLFNCIQLPMGAAIFSMITFYMISAAYRSFKIKSAEAALLMLSAMIVMVGQMPIGEWLAMPVPDQVKPLQLPWLAQKLLAVFNAAAYRGVLIGMLVGGISISLRVWLGLDNSVYSSLDKNK